MTISTASSRYSWVNLRYFGMMTLPPREKFSLLGSLSGGSNTPQDGRGGVAEMKASLDRKPARPLTAADLCDRCSARAAVETVMMQGGSLLWCAHHFAFFEDALNAFGATILVDERRRAGSRSGIGRSAHPIQ